MVIALRSFHVLKLNCSVLPIIRLLLVETHQAEHVVIKCLFQRHKIVLNVKFQRMTNEINISGMHSEVLHIA